MGRKILLVEDDRETADYLVRGLSEEGHGVEHVSDGREGLFRATGQSFDLIILDRMVPALDGLKREWREASDILGGSAWHFWRYVAIPILWPSLAGTTVLLFANAFGAVATAYGLMGSGINLVTIMLFAQIRGDVLHDQNLGYAIALGMVVITVLSNLIYIFMRARTRRDLR